MPSPYQEGTQSSTEALRLVQPGGYNYNLSYQWKLYKFLITFTFDSWQYSDGSCTEILRFEDFDSNSKRSGCIYSWLAVRNILNVPICGFQVMKGVDGYYDIIWADVNIEKINAELTDFQNKYVYNIIHRCL